ncbi:MAG TPA: hypothetical protein VFT66_22075 [Roseiflexaceae bacterium]|nr:hypothetical protein [Roseiflexaceae bacterium]
MATTRKGGDERIVSRTYRAAIRVGEDFITLEETVTLPIDATDEEVAQAVDLGMRIYQAQREAIEAQATHIRETAGPPPAITVRDPDSPASDKQRNYIATLQDTLGWSNEQLTTYASENSVELVTMTKGQASTFIDGLKRLSEERGAYNDAQRSRNERAAEAPANDGARANGGVTRANERQISALERLAQQHRLDLGAESQQRYGVPVDELSYDQASALLRELQRPAQPRRPANEPAL